ncbi:MAG: DNA repair protein RecO [Clostridia bacterium]|nr:DNA repair protein RecO [Clostridia bacterium]
MILTVKGLVLRSTKYGESDKLITVLTENGKMFFKARGIRSITSKNAAGCASFVYSEFILEKRGDRCFLRKAQPLYATVRQGADIVSLSLASYLASLAEETALDAETGRAVLRLLMNALYLIAKEDRPCDLIKAVFEMRLMAALGQTPNLYECAGCEKEADAFPFVFFRPAQGDFLCSDCADLKEEGLVRVSREVLALCRHSVECDESHAYALKLPDSLLRDFSRFAERYLTDQLERGFKTLDFYREVSALPAAPAKTKEEKNETV